MKICTLARLFTVLLLLCAAVPAQAQTVIRDTEIEEYMGEWFKPIFTAAGMSPDQVKIIIVQDDRVNAFVAGGSNIFLNTGLLQKTDSPGEVIAVMAHELGHITGGHLIRGKAAMEQASYESVLAMILGVGTAIATGKGEAATVIGAGGSGMAQRGFLKHSRTYESSADQAALKFFNAAQMNPTGFGTFMHKLEGQEMLPSSQQSEYVQSHPLTRDRIETIENRVAESAYKDKQYPQEWKRQHRMMIAKLNGYISPQRVAWDYSEQDNSIEALTARAVAAYRTNDVGKALSLADKLLAAEPNNPYFLELKAQMLMDFGKLPQAIPLYQKAVNIKPDAALIRIPLAHAQIETAGNDPKKLNEALQNLKIALKSEPRSSRIHRLMATAYGRTGDEARAKLHLAEEALLQNKQDYAKAQAEAALKSLKTGSADWIRANDILNYVQSNKDREDS